MAEQWGEKITIMTVGFEKAFDKISHIGKIKNW